MEEGKTAKIKQKSLDILRITGFGRDSSIMESISYYYVMKNHSDAFIALKKKKKRVFVLEKNNLRNPWNPPKPLEILKPFLHCVQIKKKKKDLSFPGGGSGGSGKERNYEFH